MLLLEVQFQIWTARMPQSIAGTTICNSKVIYVNVFFRCASISSTYPCQSQSVRPLVGHTFGVSILSPSLVALCEKLKKADPNYFYILGLGRILKKWQKWLKMVNIWSKILKWSKIVKNGKNCKSGQKCFRMVKNGHLPSFCELVRYLFRFSK